MEVENVNVGIVVIGRNEGKRLIACLDSLSEYVPQIVYVDSGSTDNSVIEAQNRGAHVMLLDISKKFTAARARNVGFETITNLYPHLMFVQFVDGDCIVESAWIKNAIDFMQERPSVAVVCGRRKEIFPEKSIYNMMCDLEWDTPIGEAKACGGDALIRVEAFKRVGGYRESLIAGEEPELCVRIRQTGYKVWRLDSRMTLHDAAIMHFSQWWKRTVRAGYAFAEGTYLHGVAPEYHWVTESRRSWRWGIYIPLVIVILALIKPIWAILLLLIYPLQWLRLSLKIQQPFKRACLQAFFLMVGKFAEAFGQIKFLVHRYTNQQGKIIEYK